jgi:hypothetical protein
VKIRADLIQAFVLAGLFVNAFSARALEVGKLEMGERAIDLSHITVDRFAKAIGNDPEALFAFVRDEVSFEPYVGCLRGARGTLMAQAGNSLDRALLVSGLFKACGYRAQMMRGTLPAEKLEALAQSFFMSVSVAPPETPATSTQDKSGASTATQTALRTISSALSSPDHAVAPPASIEDISREGRDHFWVRYEKDGLWIDVDPTFRKAKLGETFGTDGKVLPSIPDELKHQIVVRIFTRASAEKPAEPIYEWRGTSAEMCGDAFIIEHLPARRKKAGLAVGAASALAGSLAPEPKGDMIAAVVNVGGRQTRSRPFALGEAVAQKPQRLDLNFMANRHAADSSPIVREWLEIEMKAPDGKIARAQRTLHDDVELADPDLVKNHLFVLSIFSGVPDRRHYPTTASHAPLAPGDFETRRILRGLNVLLLAESGTRVSQLKPSADREVRFVIATPQVVISDLRKSASGIVVRGDLRHLEARSVANYKATAADNAIAQVLRGIFNTHFEAYLFAQAFPAKSGVGAASNAADILDRVAAEGELKQLTAADVAKLPLLKDVRETALAEIRGGTLLFGPTKPVAWQGQERVAWWKADSRAGSVIGVTENGLCQAGPEWAAVHESDEGRTEADDAFYEKAMEDAARREAEGITRLYENYSQRSLPNAPVSPSDPAPFVLPPGWVWP